MPKTTKIRSGTNSTTVPALMQLPLIWFLLPLICCSTEEETTTIAYLPHPATLKTKKKRRTKTKTKTKTNPRAKKRRVTDKIAATIATAVMEKKLQMVK